MAEEMLDTQSCSGLFGGLAPDTSAWSLWTQVSVTSGPLPPDWYAATTLTGDTVTFNVQPPGTYFPASPFAPPLDPVAAGQVIIHELAHVAVAKYGPQAVTPPHIGRFPMVWTQQDAHNPMANAMNSSIVSQSCGIPGS